MIKVSRSTSHHRSGTITYHVELEKWERWKWYRAQVYHFYDMKIPAKVPGFRALIKLMGGETDDTTGIGRLRSWMVNQDLKCFHYCQQRHALGRFEVSKEVYETMEND